MLVLLVTPRSDDDAGLALAATWSGAAPRSVVEPIVLPTTASAATPSADAPGPASSPGGARPGVFVPTTALGLRSVAAAPPSPEVELLRDRAAEADVVVVHVPVLDAETLHGGPVAHAAGAAAPYAVPVVVLAGEDRTVRRELAGAGVSACHVVGRPWDRDRVAAAARTWVPSWGGPDPAM